MRRRAAAGRVQQERAAGHTLMAERSIRGAVRWADASWHNRVCRQHGRCSRQDMTMPRAELGGPGLRVRTGLAPAGASVGRAHVCDAAAQELGQAPACTWRRSRKQSGFKGSLLPKNAPQGRSVHWPSCGAQGGSSIPGIGARWGWQGWAIQAGCKYLCAAGSAGQLACSQRRCCRWSLRKANGNASITASRHADCTGFHGLR